MELNKELNKTATASKSKLAATIKENNKPAFWFLMPSLLILTLFTFYPMIMTVYNSFLRPIFAGKRRNSLVWGITSRFFKIPYS